MSTRLDKLIRTPNHPLQVKPDETNINRWSEAFDSKLRICQKWRDITRYFTHISDFEWWLNATGSEFGVYYDLNPSTKTRFSRRLMEVTFANFVSLEQKFFSVPSTTYTMYRLHSGFNFFLKGLAVFSREKNDFEKNKKENYITQVFHSSNHATF